MKKVIFILLIILSIKTYAQDIDTQLVSQTLTNLDELMNLWYVRIQNDTFVNSQGLDHDLDISDSLIISRLHYINTNIPLTFNSKVRRWIDFYLQREQSIPTFLGLGQYYFPIFEQILDKYDLPLELKYLPIIESAFNIRAKSRAGAVGLWQIMYGTGKLYGLEINSMVDERLDPIKSTEAAARILKDLYDKYHDWYLALAAYNAGPGNVNKAIRRSGGKVDFWQLYPYLPRETRGYVPAFIAIVYIMNYAPQHNYYPIQTNLPNTDTVMINDTLHLGQVADVLKIPLDELKDFNPQYKWQIIPGHIKPYPLRLPSDKILDFISLEDSIFHYKDSVYFKNKVLVPATTYAARGRSYSYTPCTTNTQGKAKLYYTVKAGDNWGYIADWYDVTIRDLKCWNNRWSNRIQVGEKIVVYVPKNQVAKYSKVNSMTFEQKQNYTGTKPVNTTKPNDPNYVYYQVKRGESLYIIAQKFSDITVDDLIKINGFNSYEVRHLKPGQWIKIKRK